MGPKQYHGRVPEPHYKAITDEAHLSVGFVVADVQKTWFAQALAPEASRQWRSLTSKDVRSPRPLRELHERRGVRSPQPSYITISGAVLTKKGKQARQMELEKMAEVSRNYSLSSGAWVCSTRGAATASISQECFLNSRLAAVTCRGIDGAGCALVFKASILSCSSSMTFPRERLYEHRTMNIIIQEIYLIAHS